MLKNSEYWNVRKMISSLVENQEYRSGKYVCPECGGSMDVQFEKYRRGVNEILGVHARCNDCDIAIALDYQMKD